MKKVITTLSLLVTVIAVLASNDPIHRELRWKGINFLPVGNSDTMAQPYFEGAQFTREYGNLPLFRENIPMTDGRTVVEARLTNMVFDVAPEGLLKTAGIEKIGDAPNTEVTVSYDRGAPTAVISILPFRLNDYSGQYEALLSFDLILETTEGQVNNRGTGMSYAANSVLSSGTWHKLAVTETGVHIITYADLQSMGINPSGIDPRNLRLFGNGGGMLSESLSDARRDDLAENTIYVAGENDGKFDPQDYILFYGESPHEWVYQPFSQAFIHIQNIYSDSTYYFLNSDTGPGKRITNVQQAPEPANVAVDRFTDHVSHELDLFNLINTGRVWYGEVFDVNTTYNFSYTFEDLDLTSPAFLRAYVAAKSVSTSTFTFYNGNAEIMTASIAGIPGSSETYARAYVGNDWFQPSSNNINIRIAYQKPTSGSMGWLNFLELNVTRLLKFSGHQMSFRDPASSAPGNVAEFTLGNAGQGIQIWNVTDPVNAGKVMTTQSGNNQIFKVRQDSLQEFIAFDGSSFLPVKYSGKVPNQNLHGAEPPEMVIITHTLFLEQAQRLADFHRTRDGMSVLVTEIGKVYNEFSSGAQDITAIRDFMKMLYDQAPEGQGPKYLLLFGDASFDYKDRIDNNSNYIPTWEDDESLTIVYSVVTDDYFGFLDGPGDNLLDIGIGRIPVQTVDQAKLAVDKIIHYATNTPVVMQDWRNTICFVADDEDANLHLDQAEGMAAFMDSNYREYNVDKIYVDAFPQISTPGGQRAPDVNKAIDNRISKGSLVMNYTGHGGEVGWGHERFLEISDINSWSNYDQMPIFITATCEFSRYDDPERVSAGEMVYLNINGGAIAMFTTARATFGGSNFNLNTALFEIMFERDNGKYYRFGDLIRIAKNRGGVVDNDRKFILLGDPALHLSYPELEVYTTKINGANAGTAPDTLQALGKVTIEGVVMQGEEVAEGFNGTIYPIVFDKPSLITTLDTDPTSQAETFELQNNILYKGKARVNEGKFSFTFIVPKDIAYQYGFGKISYYAQDGNETDAHGCYDNIIVGGLDQYAEVDNEGPDVRLYMNDEHFIFGGITDQNPIMLAYVSDDSGINTIGTGIGHDIVAVLDGNTEKPIILNEFYEADLNSYSSGAIRYPFHNLAPGRHTLSLKVWDVFNNSGEAYIEFNVISSEEFVIEELSNYPNPFNFNTWNGTTFVISHNQQGGGLDVTLRIYNLAGQIVKSVEAKVIPEGFRTEVYTWSGRGDAGNLLAQGIYFYRMTVKNEKGQVAGKDGKLILMN